jgi:Tfp pilus assembly protein PilN
MRPVNLIPPEDRRGNSAPLRTGPTAYILIGALAIALLAVTALVLTGNGIKDREAELDALEARQATANATAAALQPYVEFASMSAARDETVASLAASRFDWERVLRELALVIPEDVWLSTATGTAGSGGASSDEDDSSSLQSGTGAPALELAGCAAGQRAVAGFVAALEDIDGATRIGLSSAERGSGSTAGGTSEDCRTRNFISQFEVVVVFDEAVPGAAVDGGTAAPAAPTTDPATADAVAQEQQAADSTAAQTEKARDAANLVGASQ